MVGLHDMEELIGTVSDKDVAQYLREALACYGAGAHRACIVLCHIALFDSLRRKIRALAPVNAIAKSVSDAIEPLASAQKVFETPLIQKLKAAAIISELEAQILEQLNNQRNKAAHPSGHVASAEEARFVFSEAIQKFISPPIRQTSYVVDQVIGKMNDENFFPSAFVNEMEAVVDQELANFDKMAMPFLIAKLVDAWDSTESVASKNAVNFFLVLAAKHDQNIRESIIKKLIDPKSSNDKCAEFFSMLAASDPELLSSVAAGTKLRYRKLLLSNAENVGVTVPYQQLRNPAHVLGNCLQALGEDFMLSEMNEFTVWVIQKCPYSPEFIRALSGSSQVFALLFDQYLAKASSSQWNESNPFAAAAPAMDSTLALAVSDGQAFELLAAIVRGAEWNGFGPLELANSAFDSLPKLKAKAKAFSARKVAEANKIVSTRGITINLSDFVAKYLA